MAAIRAAALSGAVVRVPHDSLTWTMAGGTGVPIANLAAPANPLESTLAEEPLPGVHVHRPARSRPRSNPPRLVGDWEYDVDALRKWMDRRGIELTAPYRENRVAPPTQNGRKLQRHTRRWIIERTNRRLNTAFLGFHHVAIIMICLRSS